MGYKLEYAGIKLHEIIQINKINTSILPSRENFSKVIPINDGSYYNGYRYSERIISVEINIPTKTRKDFNDIVQKLAYILNVKSPSRLIIDDSNIVYYAVIDGDTDISKLFKSGSATLNFVCHDPVGYDKKYSGIIMNNDKMFKFTNMGTYNSYPILGFTFTKPSTFIYLTNENGESLMVGSQKDDTAPSVQETTTVVNDYCDDSSSFTQGGNITVSDNRIVSGNYGVGNNGLSIVATSYGTDVENKWTGPTFRRNVGKNLDQFEVRVNMSFSSQGKNFTVIEPKELVRVICKSGTTMHKDNDKNSAVIQLIPYGTDLNIITMGNYGYCSVKYNNKVGWIDTKHIARISLSSDTKKTKSTYASSTEYAEDQMGLIEALGFDDRGQLLFRFHIRDNNKYFEHVIPEVYIKDKLYLSSNTTIPTPSAVATKDDDGIINGEQPIASGVFGDWNDYTGTFTIRRKKLENGQYRWWAKINRTEDGLNVTQEIHMGPGVIDSSLPTRPLNHIVFYISKFDSADPVSVMAINHITVKDISKEDGYVEEEINLEIFDEDDYLEIDFEKCTVKLNGDDFIHKLDIGSQFFNVEQNSKIIVKSDDNSLSGVCSYRKRYI